MSTIARNLQAVHERIAAIARTAQRDPHTIRLLAVSKTFGPDAIIEAARSGQTAFGENYLQEALDKMAALKLACPDILFEWHFIGPIQSNKTRPIAEHFDWVHSVEREKIAQRLSEQRPAHLPPLNICLQVNISGEASKSGVAPQDALTLARAGADVAIADIQLESDSGEDAGRYGALAQAARAQGMVYTEATVDEIRALGRRALALKCDVTDRGQVHAAVASVVDELGSVDILVNN
ncbi:MAG TPA: YggS family pyridoxal phosphate-dependent enzyme, partial [Oxalobacteraceae bacterium]|nr:YggS family pyridoxal phosphate-dependent enzyme [Oxalobacteraceae bacterium]